MITRSQVSPFPIDNAEYGASGVTPTITIPVLGNQGDILLLDIDVVSPGLSATVGVTSITVAGAPGLEFQKVETQQYVAGAFGNDVESWWAEIPESAAGSFNVVLTPNTSATTDYFSITIDCLISGLGTGTVWLPEVVAPISNPSSTAPAFPALLAPTTPYEMAYRGYMQCTSVTPVPQQVMLNGTSFFFSITDLNNVVVFGTPLTGGDTYQPIAETQTANVSAAIGIIWLAYVPASTVVSFDTHLMDAEQVEVNTQATPGPTSWQPPRDIQINLLPVRQNLVPDPVGRGGGYGWTLTGGLLTPSIDYATPPLITWPAETTTGYILTSTGTSSMTLTANIPANPLTNYSFSAYLMPNQSSRLIQLVLDFISASNTVISSTVYDFNEVSAEFVRGAVVNTQSPANAVFVRIQIVISSQNVGEQHYVGAPLLEMSSFAGIYFDANFEPATDYVFEGSPNQAPSDYYPNLIAKLSRLAAVMEDYTPMGSTYSIIIGAEAMANAGLLDSSSVSYLLPSYTSTYESSYT